jgi:hypothetical protein
MSTVPKVTLQRVRSIYSLGPSKCTIQCRSITYNIHWTDRSFQLSCSHQRVGTVTWIFDNSWHSRRLLEILDHGCSEVHLPRGDDWRQGLISRSHGGMKNLQLFKRQEAARVVILNSIDHFANNRHQWQCTDSVLSVLVGVFCSAATPYLCGVGAACMIRNGSCSTGAYPSWVPETALIGKMWGYTPDHFEPFSTLVAHPSNWTQQLLMRGWIHTNHTSPKWMRRFGKIVYCPTEILCILMVSNVHSIGCSKRSKKLKCERGWPNMGW